MGSTNWPDADTEKLKELVARGYSGSQIAAMLRQCGAHYTRNAVIGRINRLGLQLARRPSCTTGIQRARYSRTRSVAARRVVAPAADTLPAAVEQSGSVARADLPPEGGSRHHPPAGGYGPGEALIALEHDDCRWPIGTVGDRSFHFCRAKALEFMPYCQHHTKMAKSTGRGEPYGWLR